MAHGKTTETFDSLSSRYEKSFKLFLQHTNQKLQAKKRLLELVGTLPNRGVFVDAGAGTGVVTAWLADRFSKTIGIEPNPTLAEDFKKLCPEAEFLPEPIEKAKLKEKADFVLCSHVLYYIDDKNWPDLFENMSSWLSPQGHLVILLQNPLTDCMKMVRHFCQRRFDLAGTAEKFRSPKWNIVIETVPSSIVAPDLETAAEIAEFILNVAPPKNPPAFDDLKRYVDENFTKDDKGYRFSCDQDFLMIRREG